ncbi:hypothetical protein P9272_03570 [Mesorhizobium sp. WSM4976]|uniref:hypothetical protein n=1 Tax=Mesorhizobium sp. WSM4976 TaxID=3038549 RepID=UPI0024177ED5|nr:hypothetical protein [Mesorhizobium sp. WSM4976]MDG4892669.1 hypothetical protein [Mesorhizobium sp. WSM4976]
MVISTNKLKPPPSTDAIGWHKITEAGQLGRYAPEAIIGAFQNAGGKDSRLRADMARYLSNLVQQVLRKRVGTNKMNSGQDIIDDVHDEFFAAICNPSCADAKGYQESFYGRLTFRLKDAIVKEEAAKLIPPPDEKKPAAGKSDDDSEAGEISGKMELRPALEESAAEGLFEVEEFTADAGVKRPDPALQQNVDQLVEAIDVERILAQIPDPRKRLAFRLHMDQVPYGGTKGTASIAGVLEIDRKTAEHWVAEVRAFLLEHVTQVRTLKRRAAGE